MLAAAKPWTYWMALPLLVSSVLALVSFGAVYLKKVVEPNVLRLDALAAASAAEARSSTRSGGQLAGGGGPERRAAPASVARATVTAGAPR